MADIVLNIVPMLPPMNNPHLLSIERKITPKRPLYPFYNSSNTSYVGSFRQRKGILAEVDMEQDERLRIEAAFTWTSERPVIAFHLPLFS